MNKITGFTKFAMLLATALLVVSPVAADAEQNQKSGRKANQRQTRAQQADQDEAISGAGRVTKSKKVNVRNRGFEHLLVQLQTKNGATRIVDLGPVKNLKEAKVVTGDYIMVTGKVIRLGDKDVLMAHALRTSENPDDDVKIDRKRPKDRRAARRQRNDDR